MMALNFWHKCMRFKAFRSFGLTAIDPWALLDSTRRSNRVATVETHPVHIAWTNAFPI
jgi:hypothetical protein